MSDIKIGDHVRPTQAIAQEVADFHTDQGTVPTPEDRYVIERVEFVVTRVTKGGLAQFPIGISPVEGKMARVFEDDGGFPMKADEVEKI